MDTHRPLIQIDEEQALFFRARRTHLAGAGAADPMAASRAILGAQAQQENPAIFALSLRTATRPTAVELRQELVGEGARRLVRTWGQRDTLHLYDRGDWPRVIAAITEWPQSGRRGGMPTEDDLEVARGVFRRSAGPLFRRELFEHIPQRYLDEVADHPGAPTPELLASTRLIWSLARGGDIVFAQKQGAEQAYVDRGQWLPDFEWPDLGSPVEAAAELARRYLGSYAPATPADIAHFFGSTVGRVKGWLAHLEGALVDVECGSRRGLLALEEDRESIAEAPPGERTAESEWPVRLLPQWDTQTMTHKDKSWVVPDLSETKLVWRKAAVNLPTVVARGRFVATWSHRATSKELAVTVRPMSLWRAGYRRQVEREADELAAHLGLTEVGVEIGPPAD